MTSPSPSSVLATLLARPPSEADPTLALRQLVAVHDALLSAACAGTSDSDSDGNIVTGEEGAEPKCIEEVVRSLLDDEGGEVQTCLDALNGVYYNNNNNSTGGATNDDNVRDAAALLAAQYLLRLSRPRAVGSAASPAASLLVGLHSVVLPLLLRPPSDSSAGPENGEEKAAGTTPPLLKRDVRDAIIEAAFAPGATGAHAASSSTASASAGELLERCTAACVDSVRSVCRGSISPSASASSNVVEQRRVVVETAAKLLVKLLSLTRKDDDEHDAEVVREAMHRVVLDLSLIHI